MKISAFVFARGGSKGLKDKNLRTIGGKSLLQIAIECARQADISDIAVSTDDLRIANIAYLNGARVIMRPPELARDDSPEWLSWRHAIKVSPPMELFVSVPTVCPLRTASDVRRTINALGNADAAVTVTPLTLHPFGEASKRRQDKRPIMNVVAACYAVRPEFIIQNDSLWDGVVNPVEIPRDRAIDIDDALDFAIAKFIKEGAGLAG